jgi:hypothetical protein
MLILFNILFPEVNPQEVLIESALAIYKISVFILFFFIILSHFALAFFLGYNVFKAVVSSILTLVRNFIILIHSHNSAALFPFKYVILALILYIPTYPRFRTVVQNRFTCVTLLGSEAWLTNVVRT